MPDDIKCAIFKRLELTGEFVGPFTIESVEDFDPFKTLAMLSEWGTGQFTVTATSYAVGDEKLDRNDYEMNVLVPIEEADAKVLKS